MDDLTKRLVGEDVELRYKPVSFIVCEAIKSRVVQEDDGSETFETLREWKTYVETDWIDTKLKDEFGQQFVMLCEQFPDLNDESEYDLTKLQLSNAYGILSNPIPKLLADPVKLRVQYNPELTEWSIAQKKRHTTFYS